MYSNSVLMLTIKPNFCSHFPRQVRLGFGLHYGWAVEGAIGSVHKIDASYLSPHVNMAARLEASKKLNDSYACLEQNYSRAGESLNKVE